MENGTADKNGKVLRTSGIYGQRRAQWIKKVKYRGLVRFTDREGLSG